MSVASTDEFPVVTTEDELATACACIQAKHPGCLLLYRGQANLHPTIRSGRSRPNAHWHPDVERSWLALIGYVVDTSSGPMPSHRMARAVLQHYGLATHFVDLTGDALTAAWFACHSYHVAPLLYVGNALRVVERCWYDPINDGNGYVFVLIFDAPAVDKTTLTLFELCDLTGFERPARQSAWLMYDRQPMLPDPNAHWQYTLRIDRAKFKSSLDQATLFPGPAEDPGYGALLSLPYVQVPLAVMRDFANNADSVDEEEQQTAQSQGDPDTSIEDACSARRVLSIPEYCEPEGYGTYDHKWKDFTLYEPFQMLVWYRWRFDLSRVHTGIKGDIRDTTKVTISRGALKSLTELAGRRSLGWPDIGAEGLFCTFAADDHDKVIEHGPPYRGVWLQREDDLILETPMSADDESLNVHAGHAFIFWDGQLIRQTVPNSCKCGRPDDHEERVRWILTIPSLISDGIVRLVPHPAGFPRWYVLW